MTPAEETRAGLARVARTQVGFCETEGPNLGPRIRLYQGATWKSPGAWYYCAAFVSWCLQEWLRAPDARGLVGAPNDPGRRDNWRFREPGARLLLWWARRRGLRVLGPSDTLEPGDIVVYDFHGKDGIGDHCGIVAAPETDGGLLPEVIEGNTDAEGSRDGDGVWPRERQRASVLEAVRLESVDRT